MTALKLSPLYKSKFMTAWRKLKPEAPPSDVTTNKTFIVISAKEQDAMSKLQKAGSEVDRLLEENAAIQGKLTADTQRISSEIDSAFTDYMTRLTQRAEALKQKLNAESKEREDAVVQQQQYLTKLKESIASGLQQENEMLIDTKMDAKKREIKMESITNEVLNTMTNLTISAPEIVFSRDDQSVLEVEYFCIFSDHVSGNLNLYLSHFISRSVPVVHWKRIW